MKILPAKDLKQKIDEEEKKLIQAKKLWKSLLLRKETLERELLSYQY